MTFAWSQSCTCSMFVSSTECQTKCELLSKANIRPMKGTMKVRAVVGKGNNTILTADVSCYCNKCIISDYCDKHWSSTTLREKENRGTSESVPDTGTTGTQNGLMIQEGDYATAVYSNMWYMYIGKIMKIDPEAGEIQILFMQSKNEDIIWVQPGRRYSE